MNETCFSYFLFGFIELLRNGHIGNLAEVGILAHIQKKVIEVFEYEYNRKKFQIRIPMKVFKVLIWNT